MEKPKISGIASYDYPGGRIDKFEIETQTDLHGPIMSLFEELGFEEEDIYDLDMEYSNYASCGGYYFIYSKKIKAHLFVDKDEILMIFDSSENREKLIKTIEKFFTVF